MVDAALYLTRPVMLTREGTVFRLAFKFREDLVNMVRQLPYAHFDKEETKTWSVMVCAQSVAGLRAMFGEGLIDVYVDDLLEPGEDPPPCKDAVLRSGTARRPYVVMMASRDDRLYTRLRAIGGGNWEKASNGMSYPPGAAPALAELLARGILEDPQNLLSPAETVVSFDARTGRFVVRGDSRAQKNFDRYFPDKDVVTLWAQKNLDVAFSDTFSEEIYRGELARCGPGVQPAGLAINLFEHQRRNIAVALERSGVGIFDSPGVGKCLDARQCIWVNGDVVQAQDLWSFADTPVLSTDGIGEWAKPTQELLVHAVDSRGRYHETPVSRLYRQYVTEALRRVRLSDGSEVTITQAHHLLTADGWTNDLRVGQHVAVPRNVSEVSGLPVDENVATLLAWVVAEGHELAGLKNGWTVRISQKDPAVLNELARIAPLVASHLGLERWAMRMNARPPQKHAGYLTLFGEDWKRLVQDCGHLAGKLSADKRVPSVIMQGDLRAAQTFLSNYFSAEGSIITRNRHVEITSASPVLMQQLSLLLRRFGIWMHTRVSWKAASNGTRIKRPYVCGYIAGVSLNLFRQHIGFVDPVKQAKLDSLVLFDRASNQETVDAVPIIRQLLAVGYPPRQLGLNASAGQAGRRLNRATAQEAIHGIDRILDGTAATEYRTLGTSRAGHHRGTKWSARVLPLLENPDEALLTTVREQLVQLVDSDLHFAKIVSIEPVEYDGYVYDLEVPEYHNFVAGGLVCHNTASGIGAGLALLERKQVTRTVVVVPGAVRTQWAREIARFCGLPTDTKGLPDPGQVVVVDGSKQKREAAYARAHHAPWVIVNYDVLGRDYKLIAPVVAGSLLVLDEAHRIKNPMAARTKAVRQLGARAARRIALSGTPVENDPGEWFSLISGFIAPGVFGSYLEYAGRYQYPNRWGGYEGARNLSELRERSKVFFVRHTKAQVAKHLPPLRVQHKPIDPEPAYAAALKRAHKEARDEIKMAALERTGRAVGGKVIVDSDWEEIETGAEMTAVGLLKAMTSSPRLIHLSDAPAARAMVESGLVPEIDGPKLDEFRLLAAEHQAAADRVVVFTYSRTMADLICERLTEDGIRHVRYTGNTSADDRDAAVLAFTTADTEEQPGPTVFVATDAAAEGLNLGTCCSTLVNFDVPYTPGRMEQRSNRIHRIDGTSPRYLVINYTLTGTIEHGLLQMVETKADLQDAIFGETDGRRKTTGRRPRKVFEQAMDAWNLDVDPVTLNDRYADAA